MKTKSIINYIENGQEKTININFYNKTKTLKKIFENYNNELFYQNENLKIKDNIEYIHFKNIKLETNCIECKNSNTICILEDCTLKTINKNDDTLEIFDGYFEIINPNFINVSELYSDFVNDFNFTMTKENTEEKSLLDELSLIITSYQNITLNGNFNLYEIVLSGNKINLGKKDSITTIKNNTGIYIEAHHDLELNNCTIEKTSSINNIEFEYQVLKMDDKSIIKSPNRILINYKTQPPLHQKNKLYVLTLKDLKRENLISILKGYQNVLNKIIEKKKENILEGSFNSLKEEIKEQETKLKKLNQKLDKKTIKKEKLLTRNLTQQKIKNYIK